MAKRTTAPAASQTRKIGSAYASRPVGVGFVNVWMQI